MFSSCTVRAWGLLKSLCFSSHWGDAGLNDSSETVSVDNSAPAQLRPERTRRALH
ncbi:UNVERIFIED_CONTAM: hypothetical protein FKN15_020469 [Acipenser sinensis]